MLEEQNGLRPRTLFQIVLKVLGIFFLRDAVYVLPRLLTLLAGLYSRQPEETFNGNAIYLVVESAIALVMPLLLLFKTDFVIDRLRLDAGLLEQTIPVNVHRSTVVSLAVLITGGLITINAAPELAGSTLDYITSSSRGYEARTWTIIAYPALRFILGLLIIGYNQQLTLWLEQRRRMRL